MGHNYYSRKRQVHDRNRSWQAYNVIIKIVKYKKKRRGFLHSIGQPWLSLPSEKNLIDKCSYSATWSFRDT